MIGPKWEEGKEGSLPYSSVNINILCCSPLPRAASATRPLSLPTPGPGAACPERGVRAPSPPPPRSPQAEGGPKWKRCSKTRSPPRSGGQSRADVAMHRRPRTRTAAGSEAPAGPVRQGGRERGAPLRTPDVDASRGEVRACLPFRGALCARSRLRPSPPGSRRGRGRGRKGRTPSPSSSNLTLARPAATPNSAGGARTGGWPRAARGRRARRRRPDVRPRSRPGLRRLGRGRGRGARGRRGRSGLRVGRRRLTHAVFLVLRGHPHGWGGLPRLRAARCPRPVRGSQRRTAAEGRLRRASPRLRARSAPAAASLVSAPRGPGCAARRSPGGGCSQSSDALPGTRRRSHCSDSLN